MRLYLNVPYSEKSLEKGLYAFVRENGCGKSTFVGIM